MAFKTYPVKIEALYWGPVADNEWTDKETGQVNNTGPRTQFLLEAEDGSVIPLVLSNKKLDTLASFDVTKLKLGDRVNIAGNVRGADFYLSPESVEKAGAPALAVAS